MPGEYRRIQEYEKEMIKLYGDGLTLRKTGEKFGLTYKQMREFKSGYNRKQKKLEVCTTTVLLPARPAPNKT